MTHRIAPALGHLAVPIGDLVENPANPRRGDPASIALSLDRFGQRQPVVYRVEPVDPAKPRGRKRKVVYVGNHRLQAARDLLGWDMIAAIDADDLDPDEVRAYALADNHASDVATYDETALLAELTAAAKVDDLLAATGFDLDHVEFLARRHAPHAPPDEFGSIDVDNFDLPHVCPRCGFEFTDG